MSRYEPWESFVHNNPRPYYFDRTFEEYSPKYKDAFFFEKKAASDGNILIAKWHLEGKEMQWGALHHRGIGHLCNDVSQDKDIDVFILGGHGYNYVGATDVKALGVKEVKTEGEKPKAKPMEPEFRFDGEYWDGVRTAEALVNMEPITIGVINGPGYHTEYATLCDITLIADNAKISDPHFYCGHVPGDGVQLSWADLMGDKRYAYSLLTNEYITPQKAVEYGLANEVVSSDKIYDRAVEIAEQIMTTPRVIRRLTTQVIRQNRRELIARRLRADFATELFASCCAGSGHEQTSRWPEIVQKLGCKLPGQE